MALGSVIADSAPPFAASPFENRTSAVDNLLNFIESEYKKGNQTVTKEKYRALLEIQKKQKLLVAKTNNKDSTNSLKHGLASPPLPKPLYPPLFSKFKLPNPPVKPIERHHRRKQKKLTFKYIESVVIAILETLANILDNLHLFSKFPMFPKVLTNVLQHTNRLWVLILVFLIRKTVSQLLNVIRKEKKVNTELNILKSNTNSKLLEEESEDNDSNILRKYEKVIRDLKFDKMMLKIELIGNFLDLSFNIIELYDFPVPTWFMNTLNFASMAMTIYRMNKDDEYVDDDITEDLI
ncbi:CIC11C00000002891 [Sungouiella intermedia]|uniref:CIC11C00000002891 n=1 Tax=Sungouiella intermedia TaxID=45354 RepID=A0A1L0B651_9ASCO|nr:CIC11C00000002891 [[Candida] intermedia]